MVIFVDDFTRMRFVYFLQHKSETLNAFKEFIMIILKLSGIKLCHPHCDNGGEYTSKETRNFCITEGIQRTFTSPETLAQNGFSERSWRSILDKTRCMWRHVNMEQNFWSFAADCSCSLLNRIPTRSESRENSTRILEQKNPT